MKIVILGNALCFIGSVVMIVLGLVKNKRKYLVGQCVQNTFFAVGNYLLGGISGTITNAVVILRNLLCVKWRMNVWLKLLFIALQVGLTVLFGVNSLILWLPIIANCYFTWIIDTENMVHMKIVLIVSSLMWAVYDYTILNFATVPMDIAAVVTNTVALVGILRGKEKIKG